jgi:hypothetical protein
MAWALGIVDPVRKFRANLRRRAPAIEDPFTVVATNLVPNALEHFPP